MAPTEAITQEQSGEERKADLQRCDSSVSDYGLKWLFDPHRYDHLPIEEQLNYYKKRDLSRGKLFRISNRIFGDYDKPRKRKIIASALNKELEGEHFSGFESSPFTSPLKPQQPHTQPPTQGEINAFKQQDQINDYKKWVNDRKEFRKSLDSMGLNEEWLANKKNRTPLEERVLRKMIADRTPKPVTPPPSPDDDLEGVLPEESPIVKRPSPLAISIIEQFLREKKMRLIDLFSSVDKNRDWLVSREEFRSAIEKAKIPISDVLLEDLIMALDEDLNDQLDYRELAKGMGLWKIEKRENKRKVLANTSKMSLTQISQLQGFEPPDHPYTYAIQTNKSCLVQEDDNPPILPRETHSGEYRNDSPVIRAKSAISTISTASSPLLELPPPDLRREQRHYTSEEAMVDQRKQEREVMNKRNRKKSAKITADSRRTSKGSSAAQEDRKTMVKIGDKAIDDHCTPSTLGGETADLVDKFRQLQFKEYNEITKLCQRNNVPFTKELLDKVLMYPPDKQHGYLRRHLRQPGSPLLSVKFAETPEPIRSPEQEKHKVKAKIPKSGKKTPLHNRHAFPAAQNVTPIPMKVNLSTGKGIVQRQVDCWLTYEEYEQMTRHLAQRYTKLHGRTDDNAFWPGHLLDKVRLYMPDSEPKASSVFNTVQRDKIYPLATRI